MAARQETPALDAFVAQKLNLHTGRPHPKTLRWPGLAVTTAATVAALGGSADPTFLPVGILFVAMAAIGGVLYVGAKSAVKLQGLSRTKFTQLLALAVKTTRKSPLHPATLQFLETGAAAYQTVRRCCPEPSIVEAAENAMEHLVVTAMRGKLDEHLRDDLVKLGKEAATQSGLPENPDQEVREELREALAKLTERRKASEELKQSIDA